MEKSEDKIIEYIEIMNKKNIANIEKYLNIIIEKNRENMREIFKYIEYQKKSNLLKEQVTQLA